MPLRALAAALLCALASACAVAPVFAQPDVVSLPPSAEGHSRAPVPYSCGELQKLVQLFGVQAVMDEARRRGISEERISHVKRKCGLEAK